MRRLLAVASEGDSAPVIPVSGGKPSTVVGRRRARRLEEDRAARSTAPASQPTTAGNIRRRMVGAGCDSDGDRASGATAARASQLTTARITRRRVLRAGRGSAPASAASGGKPAATTEAR